MPYVSFEEFCSGLCRSLGVECPELRDGEGPWRALTLTIDDVEVGLLQPDGGDPARALVMLEFGPLPEKDEALACRSLLETNFLLMGDTQPVFSIHPLNGTVFLHQGFAFGEVDAATFEAHARQLTAAALRWRSGEFVPSDLPAEGDAAFMAAVAGGRA